jgi:hypothetical protein
MSTNSEAGPSLISENTRDQLIEELNLKPERSIGGLPSEDEDNPLRAPIILAIRLVEKEIGYLHARYPNTLRPISDWFKSVYKGSDRSTDSVTIGGALVLRAFHCEEPSFLDRLGSQDPLDLMHSLPEPGTLPTSGLLVDMAQSKIKIPPNQVNLIELVERTALQERSYLDSFNPALINGARGTYYMVEKMWSRLYTEDHEQTFNFPI